jgi:hypothetical protein
MKPLLYTLVSLVSIAFATFTPEGTGEVAVYRAATPQATLALVSPVTP